MLIPIIIYNKKQTEAAEYSAGRHITKGKNKGNEQ